MTAGAVTVLIATPLEAEFVHRIEAADPRVCVIYEPDLLPVPQYAADHGGTPRVLPPAELARWADLRALAEVSFDFDWQAPGQMAANCPRLRWVQGTSAGLGGFLQRTGLDQTPLVFTTAAGVHGVPLAEFALAGLLYFIKDVPGLRARQGAALWLPKETAMLAGSRALVVGLGGIGREVARALAAAGVEVIGAGRPGRDYDIPGVSGYVTDTAIDEVLPGVSSVVLACPLTERTRHLIGARQLALLPAGAVVVNVARGAVIDEAALAEVLASGHLGGAALDVFEQEPLPPSSPLWAMDKVLVSPHTASTVATENRLITDLFIDNLHRWLNDAPLRNVYDRAAGFYRGAPAPHLQLVPNSKDMGMAQSGRLRVAVVGTGSWAQRAHIPGWQRDPRVEVVALADTSEELVREAGKKFGTVPVVTTDYRELLADPGIDVIDVVTGNSPHFQISWDALSAGKHVLCEKPVHNSYLKTREAAELAAAKGLRTKLGFTFRYAPAVLYAKELIDEGFVGEPYVFNGYEQNSQWLDPATPLRQVAPAGDPDQIAVSSIEGYGAPIIDIMHWWLDAPLTSVVGTMRNFVPQRVLRDTGQLTRVNIDDGDMWIAEFGSGAIASIQSSYVTVGNYPGIEARIYGSQGAIIIRLVEEAGICQTIRTARKDAVEFTERQIPERFFPPGGASTEPWPFLFYSNLISDFASEILHGGPSQGDFAQGALVQETINAFEASFRARAWVGFPLAESGGAPVEN